MSNKEIVQQGLDARKNTRAAEAKADKYRELAISTHDMLFLEQMSHKQAQRVWREEKDVLAGIIYRQNGTITGLRQNLAAAEDRAREGRQLRALISAAKAVGSMFVLIGIRDIGWIVPWLADSLVAASAICLTIALVNWFRNQ